MNYESSDILGGRSLKNDKSDDPSVFFKFTGLAALGLFAWLAWFRGRVIFLKWKETRYKKAMRRRHGIPDEDERPFNVAYAAAVRAREREDEGGSAPGATGRRLRNALSEGQQSLRQRFDDVAPQIDTTSHWQYVNTPIVPQVAQAYAQIKQQQQNGVQVDPLDFEARYNPNPPTVHVTDFSNDASSSRSQQPSKLKLQNVTDHIRKRSFDDDEDDLEPTKKSRVEGEELIDGDEDAEWAFKRGSKRGLATEDDDEGYESTRGDKRPRNVSRDKTPEDQVMEDDADDVAELRSIPRGKKRDRAEAGSTFGGDDDEVDDQMNGKASRSRKRKMISKRKSDAQAQVRGRKRNRDADISESEEEEDDKRLHVSRKKRGKKGQEDDGDGSDVSMNESLISRSSYVKGRRIGEEWEVNGVLYKVGLNGQRLRQALVKKARNKFPMPKDSQHPDREANLEVYVETWLTENEYKEAKERHELAWQDTPKPSAEPETPGDVQDSPSIKGKNLLWASAAAQESPAPKRRLFRESIATSVGLRIDAFPDAQASSRRRVASAYSPLAPGGTAASESPTRGYRTFSKWEKQDLEAEAMAKMRAKLQEQKKVSSSDPKSVGLGAPPLVASASAPGPTNTGSAASFTFAKPADKPNPASVTASLSLGASPSTSASAKPADTDRPSIFPFAAPPANGGDSKTQTSISFSKPSGGAPSSTNAASSMSFPALPSSQPDPSKPASSSSPAPSGSSNMPNFFGPKGGSSNVGSTTTPTPISAPGAQPASTKAPAFGFNAPMSGFPSAAPTNSSSFSFSSNQAGKTPVSPFSGGAQSDPKKPEVEKPAQSSESGGSLLGRMGGFAAPQSASQSFTAQSTTPSGSPFSFGKTSAPGAEPAKPMSVFGASSTANESTKALSLFNQPVTTGGASKSAGASSTPQNGSTTTGPTTSAPAPKFNFGFTKNSAPSPALGTSSSSAPASEPSKTPSSSFDFNALKSSAQPTAPAESSTGAAAPPKFQLNMTSGGSPFGATSSLGGALSNTATKPAFGGSVNNGNGLGTSNPFSTTPSATTNSSLSKPTFSFGNTGGSTTPSTVNKPADAAKSTISFSGNANPTTPSTSGAPAPTSNSQSKPFSFAFGNTSSSTAPSPFGAQPSTTPSSNANGTTQSVFGKTSTPTPSAFGFGSFGQSGQSQEGKK